MSGMSTFLSSFHYAVKHCLTILWQILDYFQKSHFIFFQDGDQIPPQIWVRSTSSCLSSMSDLQFRHYKWELDMFSCTISWNSVCKETCQVPPDCFVSDSLWIWETFVPKTATCPMSSKCSAHKTEPHFNFYFLNFHIIHARENIRKTIDHMRNIFFLFFLFNLGLALVLVALVSLYSSQWAENLRNTEIPERILSSKAFISMEPEFLCQQSMTECI